jgi:hypothetical protein
VDVVVVHTEDCPCWPEAARRVREAMRRVGLDPASLRYQSNPAEQVLPGFPGSPTVLVDGRDPFVLPAPAGPVCRLYQTEAGLDCAPSVAQLVAALTR